MVKCVIAGLVISIITAVSNAGETMTPVWDLSKNEIPVSLQSGTIEKVDGKVALKDGAAFAVPAEAFTDPKNFTVQVTASLTKLVNHTRFTVMKKQGKEDTGFSFSMNYRDKPYYARQISSVVNNVFMSTMGIGGKKGPQTGVPYTFTLSVRNGFASFYIDDKPYKKCFMEVIPNADPMWIGRNLKPKEVPMEAVISSVKVYGPDFSYVSSKEPKQKFPRGVIAGKGWALDTPQVTHPEWPKVLIYGDSISMGYRSNFISDLIKKNIYVYHCCHFVGGNVPQKALAEMAGRFPFDAIVFNNGLHSLHWTPEKVSDEIVHRRMTNLAQCFKKGAPKAKVFYLMTTPHTAKRPAPGKPVNALGDKNAVVLRLNTISAAVMKEKGIEVIDVYTPLSQKLELAGGDGYHWHRPAYKLISDEIQNHILPIVDQK